nr:hypothetical protein [Nitrosopumilus sp.]
MYTYDKEITYDNIDYEEKLAYFNYCSRHQLKFPRWKKIFDKYNLIDSRDNTNALYIVDYYLRGVLDIT